MQRFNPLDWPLGFVYPARLTHSQWMEHTPFAMALVEMIRPRLVVELGTHYGVSYCAFCQAVAQLGLPARAFAVDTWRGDPHSGHYGDEVLADLRAHHDRLYGSFSRLVQSTFDDALTHFADGSVDLLHIDGYHTRDAVGHDFENWLPKLSRAGVVLFHDINVREHDFGVWRFWEEARSQYPSFEFHHQHGLGVIAVGPEVPEALRPLLDAGPDEVARVRDFYFQLGQRLSVRWDKERNEAALTVQLADERAAYNCARTDARSAWAAEVEQARAAWAAEAQQARMAWEAEVTPVLEGLRGQLAERETALASAHAELARLSGLAEEHHRSLCHFRDQAAAAAELREHLNEQSALAAARQQEVEHLRDRLAVQERPGAEAASRTAEQEKVLAAAQARMLDLDQRLGDASERLSASETWVRVLQARLAERDAELGAARAAAARHEADLRDLSVRLAAAAAALAAATAPGLVRRLVAGCARRVAPPGTRRRHWLRAALPMARRAA